MRRFLWVLLLMPSPAGAELISLDAKVHPDFVSLRRKGCISEKDFLYTVYKEAAKLGSGNRFAWDTSNAGTGWVLRYTAGTIEGLILELYKQPVLALDSAAFPVIAGGCREAVTTRDLALCLQQKTHDYMVEHDLAPPAVLGGKGAMCKLYATYAYGAAAELPPIVGKETMVSGWGHVINRIAVLDSAGRRHQFVLDPLNLPVFAKLSEDDGSCLEDAPLGSPRSQEATQRLDRGGIMGRSVTLDRLRDEHSPLP